MKVIIITFCLFGAAFANPILHNILVSAESASNSTESLPVLESSENNTSELQSSEENTSNQSSESESMESTSEDKTSEESNSQSDENDKMNSLFETKDNSMGSEENVRKQNWVRVFASVVKGESAEDKGHPEHQSNELSDKQQIHTKTVQISTVSEKSGDTTSDSADTSDVKAAASDSSDSTSSESQESQETSDTKSSSAASESTEDSDASDSAEMNQVREKDCVNSTQSCESEEYFLQSIGDDAHSTGEHLLVPDEEDRELRLRRR
ncbi:secretory calcium-binding phosphoprotein 1 [Cyprinodon tularosa]|uniref:secretory calcium-binding phosphoprotein 1 n=1 Tax=Cyprinodon tularosa TaxID=77115 RepID=UPI0018E22BD0|nr:secretory calcium-binding phosphoprotein 1 [Cyprinodon tularosa]